MPKFKVGDRVHVDGYTTPNNRGERVHVKGTGTIRDTAFAPLVYSVKMDKPYIDNYSCTTPFFAAHGRELTPLMPINEKTKLVFYIKDRTVHCKLFSIKGLMSHTQAKCSPDDTFAFLTGVQIALQRMLKAHNKELVLPTLKNIKFIDFN